MADNRQFVQGQDYTLSGSGVLSGATSVTLSSFKTPDGTNITMSDFGTLGYITFEPETSREENASFTGITQNANGTATLTGLTKGLGFVAPYTAVAALDIAHSGGTIVRITNSAPFYKDLASKENDNTFSQDNTFEGDVTFAAANIPQVDSYIAPTLDTELAAKKYVDDTAVAGAPDAGETTKGIVQLATNAEMGARTSIGGTGARLVPPNDQLVKTSSGAGDENKLAVLDATGKFAPEFIPSDLEVSYTAAEALSANVPVSKNSTADEVVNMYLSGQGTDAVFASSAVSQISACKVSEEVVAVVYVSVVTGLTIVAGTIAGNAITWGTPQVINANAAVVGVDIALVATNKVAVVYTDSSASSEGTCAIATLSGTVFTIGTPVVYSSGTNNVDYSSVCQIDSDKLLVSWYDTTATNSYVAAATISGTVSTFGSQASVDTNVVARTSCSQLDTDKALVVYFDDTSNLGEGVAITVSGTTCTVNTPATFDNSGSVSQVSCSQLDTDKAIVGFIDNSSDAYVRVVSVSGTTVSYGTALLVSSTATAQTGVRTITSLSATKAVQVLQESASGDIAYANIAISGTTATLTSLTLDQGAQDADWLAVTPVESTDRIFIAFDDDANSSYGTGYVASFDGNADQYVGMTTKSATSGNPVTVQKEGILSGFTGLSVGAAYYATSATVTTTDTGVFIGVSRDTDEIDLSSPDPSKVAKASYTASGSLITATGSAQTTELVKGTNGYGLFVNTGVANGIQWERATRGMTISIASDVTVSSSTTETTLMSFTLPANYVGTGGSIQIRNLIQNFSLDNGATATFRLKLDSTTLVDASFINSTGSPVASMLGVIDAAIMANASTSAQKSYLLANVEENGVFVDTAASRGDKARFFNVNTSSVSLDAGGTVSLTVQFSASSATNLITWDSATAFVSV